MSPNITSECVDDNTAVEFIDGLLSADEVRRVERHVARCDSCRRLLAELGRSPSMADDAPTLPAGVDAHLTLETGQQVGRFVVINRIGAGGMGVVFAAYDPKLDRKVALKLLHSREGSGISPQHAQMRLLREAQAIAQMSHENVVTVYDSGTFKSEVYIAMEFVEGDTLTRWLRRWDRHWRDVRDKFLQAGRALAHAHAGGLVHRDFKPDNVLVGNDERVRVMDFGLARSLFADPSADTIESPPTPDGEPAGKSPRALDHALTKTGTVLGTPRYMAPEQFAGIVADARSDQFSFCVALYESVYGQHPFEDRTAERLAEAPDSVRVRPPPASSSVPAWMHNALVRGLEAEPDRRFSSMDALLRAIAPRPLPEPRLRLFVPIAVAVLAVFAAVYLYLDRRDMGTHLEGAQVIIGKLEKQAQELGDQVVELKVQLEVVRNKLNDPESTPALVEKLRSDLAGTRRDLALALQSLEETEQELASYTGPDPIAQNRPGDRGDRGDPRHERAGERAGEGNGQRAGEGNDPGDRAGDERLPADEVRGEIAAHLAEFEDCFKEWRERSSIDQPLFAAELTIDADGVPKTGTQSAGIDDRVVHECVTGALEDLRFREARGPTVVQIGFTNGQLGLELQARVARREAETTLAPPETAVRKKVREPRTVPSDKPGKPRGKPSGKTRALPRPVKNDRPAASKS